MDFANTDKESVLTNLYGREGLCQELEAYLSASDGRSVVLVGPTGIGKSSLLEACADRVSDDDVLIRIQIKSKAHSLSSFVGEFGAEVAKVFGPSSPTLGSVLESLSKEPVKKIVVLAKAIFTDAASALPAGETAKAVMDAASEAVGQAMESPFETLAAASADDLNVLLDTALKEISSERGGVILIDSAENSSDAVLKTIVHLILRLPSNWKVVVAVNNETEDGQRVYRKLERAAGLAVAETVHVGGLDYGAVETWATDSGADDQLRDQAETATRELGGRPYYLKQWLNGTPLDSCILALARQVSPQYRARIEALAPGARALLEVLAVFPPELPVYSEFLAVIENDIGLSASLSTCVTQLQNAGFIRADAAGQVSFDHEETRRQVLDCVVPADRQKWSSLLSERFATFSGDTRNLEIQYAEFMLNVTAGNQGYLLEHADLLGEDLRNGGAATAAIEIYDIAERNMVEMESESRKASLQLSKAEALNSIGDYSAALDALRLSDLIDGGNFSVRAELAALLASVRLNNYEAARHRADNLLGSEEVVGTSHEIEVLRRLNVIQRDTGDYESAAKSALKAIELAKALNADARLQSRCYRTVARSLVFLADGLTEASGAAARALENATSAKAPRDIGNSYLAQAEVERHSGNHKRAIDLYDKAGTQARRIGNVDSLLWAQLGCADSLFLSGDIAQASSKLRQLDAAFKSDHPLERLHWRLSKLAVAQVCGEDVADELQEVVEDYKGLGISWPGTYVDNLLAGEKQRTPKAF